MTSMQFSLIEKINVNQPIQPTPVRMIFLDVDDPTFFITVLKKIFHETSSNYQF